MPPSSHNKRYTAEERQEVLELLREGTPIAETVRRTGVSRFTIYRWLREEGIELGAVEKLEPTVGFDRAAMRMRFEEGATAKEVAEEFGCSRSYAYQVKNGVLE